MMRVSVPFAGLAFAALALSSAASCSSDGFGRTRNPTRLVVTIDPSSNIGSRAAPLKIQVGTPLPFKISVAAYDASGAIDTPLKAAFTLAQKRYGEGMGAKNPQGLAWILATINDRAIVNHDGLTGGFASTLWVEPELKAAVAVFSNASRPITDMGLHLLEPSIPLANLAPMRATAIPVDAKSLQQWVGTYALSPDFKVTIRTRDGKLFAQATGQGEFELFAKSATVFFARVTPLEIAFEEIRDGKAGRFQITQQGSTRPAQRVE